MKVEVRIIEHMEFNMQLPREADGFDLYEEVIEFMLANHIVVSYWTRTRFQQYNMEMLHIEFEVCTADSKKWIERRDSVLCNSAMKFDGYLDELFASRHVKHVNIEIKNPLGKGSPLASCRVVQLLLEFAAHLNKLGCEKMRFILDDTDPFIYDFRDLELPYYVGVHLYSSTLNDIPDVVRTAVEWLDVVYPLTFGISRLAQYPILQYLGIETVLENDVDGAADVGVQFPELDTLYLKWVEMYLRCSSEKLEHLTESLHGFMGDLMEKFHPLCFVVGSCYAVDLSCVSPRTDTIYIEKLRDPHVPDDLVATLLSIPAHVEIIRIKHGYMTYHTERLVEGFRKFFDNPERNLIEIAISCMYGYPHIDVSWMRQLRDAVVSSSTIEYAGIYYVPEGAPGHRQTPDTYNDEISGSLATHCRKNWMRNCTLWRILEKMNERDDD